MPRRGWALPFLAVALVGGVLVTGPTASATTDQQIDLVTDKVAQLVGQSDDGDRALVFDLQSEDGLYLADLAGGGLTLLSQEGRVTSPVLSADGSTAIWSSAGDIVSADLDTMTVRSEGLPRGGVPRALSANGDVLLYQVPDGPPDAFGNPTYRYFALVRGVGGWYLPDGAFGAVLSRDGSWVAYSSRVGLPAGHVGAYRVRLSNEPELLIESTHRPEIAGISADGATVAVRDAGASVVVTPGGTVPLPGDAIDLSADGGKVSYVDGSGGGHVRDLGSGEDVSLSATRNEGPFLSGDGSTATWVSDRELHVADLGDGRQRLLCCDAQVDGASAASAPRISFDGRRITFVDGDGMGPVHTWLDRGVHPPSTTTSTTSTTVPARRPVASVSDATATEDGALEFHVTLDVPATRSSGLQWWIDDTPTPGPGSQASWVHDVIGHVGGVHFDVGESEDVFRVYPYDDGIFEGTESFVLHIWSPYDDVDLGRSVAVGTILDNDPAPVVSITDTHIAEDAGKPMTWNLSLDRPSSTPVRVQWWSFADTSAPSDRRAVADKDFKPQAGTVTFAPGETTARVSSLVFDDPFFERDEWFSAALVDATGATLGRSKAVGVINDDESARLWGLPTQLTRLLPA